jgi:hypothetical protein
MNKNRMLSFAEAPAILSVADTSALLGLSRAATYSLFHSYGFPVLKIGTRMMVPKDKLLSWIEKHTQS